MTRERRTPVLVARRGVLLLALMAAVGWLGYSFARRQPAEVVAGELAPPELTLTADERGTFLFKQAVERAGYFNVWFATSFVAGEPAAVEIHGEGKTVEFRGVLSLGGPQGEPAWTGGENFGWVLTDEELERLVPPQVVAKALAWGRAQAPLAAGR